MVRTFLVGACTVIIGLCACSKKGATNTEPIAVEDLLPKSNEISGWQRTGDFWTARSSGELNTVINGEEPDYTRHGFVEGAMQKYEGSVLGNSVTVELRIFDQAGAANAAALFTELAARLVNPIDWSPGAGEESEIERFTVSQKILFWESKYFIWSTIDSGLDEALDVLKTFANNLDTKLQ